MLSDARGVTVNGRCAPTADLRRRTHMNPNELVETIRVEVSNYRAAMTNSDHLLAAEEVVDAVEVLDSWLRHGGHLPDQWKQMQQIGA
jgi:hypothetical protein